MFIHIKVRNRIAEYIPGDQKPVCGNSTDVVKFDFDEEWRGEKTKTARFIWGNQFHDEEFTGDTCPAPMFLGTTCVLIGVKMGEEGDDQFSTTKTAVEYALSIRCGNAQPGSADVEKYTVEAKDYAEQAQASATAAGEAADRAKTISDRMQATDLSVLTQDLNFRIGQIEGNLGVSNNYTSVQLAGHQTAALPQNAKRAKITRIYGRCCNYQAYQSYRSPVYNVPRQITFDNGVSITIPYSSVLKNFGLTDQEYIFFSNGRAYYHQATRWDDYMNPVVGEGEMLLEYLYDYGAIVRLAEPIIIDVSELLNVTGMIDLTGATSVTVQSTYTRKDIEAMALQAQVESEGEGNYVYLEGGVELQIEL